MQVGWLFDYAGDSGSDSPLIVLRHQRRVLDLGAKGMIKELMTPDACADIQMMRLVFRPSGSTGATPYNDPEGAKCGTVLSGVLGLEVDGVEYQMEPGDTYGFDAIFTIRLWCIGSEYTVVIWVVTPAIY